MNPVAESKISNVGNPQVKYESIDVFGGFFRLRKCGNIVIVNIEGSFTAQSGWHTLNNVLPNEYSSSARYAFNFITVSGVGIYGYVTGKNIEIHIDRNISSDNGYAGFSYFTV